MVLPRLRRCLILNQRTNIGRSVDVIIYLDNYPLGGQQGANFVRQAQVIDITNKINGEWSENLAGTKSWSIVCAGIYVVNDRSFSLLEDAFINNKPVEVSIKVGSQQLKGKAIITEFPLNAIFNKEFKYNLRLLGTGALTKED